MPFSQKRLGLYCIQLKQQIILYCVLQPHQHYGKSMWANSLNFDEGKGVPLTFRRTVWIPVINVTFILPDYILFLFKINLFLIFHHGACKATLRFISLHGLLSILITSNPIPSYVPASPHLKTSCSTSFENSWINLLVLKKPSTSKDKLGWIEITCLLHPVQFISSLNFLPPL